MCSSNNLLGSLGASEGLDGVNARRWHGSDDWLYRAGGATANRRAATTGDVGTFVSIAERIFGAELPEVEAVRLEPAAAVPID
jgi:hypothetical protein